jgi:hypothetical protein
MKGGSDEQEDKWTDGEGKEGLTCRLREGHTDGGKDG